MYHVTVINFFVVVPGTGLAINCMSVNETFCVMGSDDGYLRLWPLDFEHVYLEAGRQCFPSNVIWM